MHIPAGIDLGKSITYRVKIRSSGGLVICWSSRIRANK